MSYSESEISKITEIVAGKMGVRMDAKVLRQVVDRIVDSLREKQGNPPTQGVIPKESEPKTNGHSQNPATLTSLASSSPTPPSLQPVQPTATIHSYQPLTPQSDQNKADANRGGLYDQIEKTDRTRIIIAVFGKNRPGIVSSITAVLAENGCSIEDISQTIMQEFFSMIMVVDISGCKLDFAGLRDKIQSTETQLGMKVYVMHEDIFRYMHRI